MIVCTGVRSGIFWDKVRFTAEDHMEATFGTFFGDKVFFMNKGDAVTLRMSKDDMWEKGDKVKSLSSLVTMNNQDKFRWKWRYM